MLTLGGGEIAVIFILALVLFGPNKLPELGRTIAKAMGEFNRARNDLKATFEREMRTMEQETLSIKKFANDTVAELADHASYVYGLPSAEEVWNPLDHEGHAVENASREQAAIAAPVENSGEHGAEQSAESAAEHSAERIAENSVETTSTSVETTADASSVPPFIPATEGTVARSATGPVEHTAQETAQAVEEVLAGTHSDTGQHL